MRNKPEPMLYLSDARGVYIPRDFATHTRRDCIAGVSQEDLDILASGPDHEFYWDAWSDVESCATVTDPVTHVVYRVYQDGDCWLIPDGMEWSEESEFFVWPESDE
jgi:hypothetical protein